MPTIELTIATPELSDQLNFLIRLEFINIYRKNKVRLYWLIGFTLFYLFVFLLPDTDRNIPLKGVFTILIGLIWLGTLIFITTIVFKYKSRIQWKKRKVSELFANNGKYKFSWDSERISYSTEKYDTSLKWDMFKYYTENKNTIYIFNGRNTYEALCYTETELGHDYYQNLKGIASR